MGSLSLQWEPTAAIVAASGYFLLVILTAHKRGLPRAVDRWFAAYLILSAIWTVAWALANVWHWVQPWVVDLGASLTIYSATLLPPALAILTLHFLPRRGTRELMIVGIIWAVAVTLMERGLLNLTQAGNWLDILRLVGWAGFILGSLLLTALEYARLHRPLHRNRVLYWLVALTLVAAGEGLQHLHGAAVAELGLPLRLAGAIMMTYAITTYSLPDLKSVGRRILLTLTVTLVRALLFLAGIAAAALTYQILLRALHNEQQALAYTIAGGVAGALFLAVLQVPIQKLISGLAERLLFGPGYDASRALRDYSQSISNILHIERLAVVAIETIAEALDVDRGALLHIRDREDGGADVRVIPGMGEIPAMNVAFAAGSAVLHTLQDNRRPVTQYDIDMLPEFRTMDPEERQWQWALDAEVYVPIHAKRTLIGALILGAKQTGEPYSAQDLDVLNTLAGQTAVALENARLFDDQRRLNEEISNLNEGLLAANTRLEKLDKAKTDFLNITSHELRTPLTQVRGYADILGEMIDRGEINTPQLLKVANSIRTATDRLEAIYSAMIDVSAIGVDALRLHYETIRPAYLILQAVAKWQHALETRQQELIISGVHELPELEGDQVRLVQAFSNLINNAIKFTPDGGRIEIWGRVVDGPESVVELTIADQGVGIDPKDQDVIFDKFYRVDDVNLHSSGTIKYKGAGPGLGLSIVKGVIERHGGRIWVESDGYDEQTCPGSRFHVLLPLRQGTSDPSQVSDKLRTNRPVTGMTKRLLAMADVTREQDQD
jgi:signal transduction histidine kinase